MVATLARAKGISHSALAVAVNIHRNRLADKIAGRRSFTEQEILDLAAYFEVDPGRLFEDPMELLGIGSIGRPRMSSVQSPSAEFGSYPHKSG